MSANSNNIFNSIELTKPRKTNFNLSHTREQSGRIGNLMPCLYLDLVPGDKVHLGFDAFIRLAPTLSPFFGILTYYCHAFFVPYRLLWPDEGWEHFITNDQDDPRSMPYFMLDGDNLTAEEKQFLDLMGIPPPDASTPAAKVNGLILAAYNRVYNAFYRDENLIDELIEDLDDGDNTAQIAQWMKIRKRAYEKDYFTGALPWAQKGETVYLPLGEIKLDPEWGDGIPNTMPKFVDQNLLAVNGETLGEAIDIGSGEYFINTSSHLGTAFAYDPKGSLVNQATPVTDLRTAFALQRWFEINARGGSRYTEHIWAKFGVRNPDFRLQRPEYITGIKANFHISEVLNNTGPLNTWDSNGDLTVNQVGAPQGDLTGKGVAITNGGHSGSYYASEYGCIIAICSVLPQPVYQQGIPKDFLKFGFEDYFDSRFEHIGEQPVQVQELYAYTTNALNTWGYVPRYSEYKYKRNSVHGDFRTTLNFWTLARIFTTEPTLSQEFIECNEAHIERIFAVKNTDHLWMSLLNRITANRPMSYFGTPF